MVVDVSGHLGNIEDLRFLGSTTSITVSGVVYKAVADDISRDDYRLEVCGVIPTATVTTATPRTLANMMGLSELPEGAVGAVLNFSDAVRYVYTQDPAILAQFTTYPTYFPLINSDLNNRTFGRVG